MNLSLRQKTLSIILLMAVVFSACESPESPSELSEAYISVHMEIYSGEELDNQWVYLQELVALADEYDLSLTLGFTANWGELFLDDDEALSLLGEWEQNGHEISAHHHGVSHATWDGYTNDPSYKKKPQYLGDIDEMMEILNQFSSKGDLTSGSMTDPETDWPSTLLYKSYGSPFTKLENILSEPELLKFNGTEVLQLMKAGYLTGKSVDVELEDLLDAIEVAEPGEIFGVALSDSSLSEEGVFEGIELLFMELEEGVRVLTLSELLSN